MRISLATTISTQNHLGNSYRATGGGDEEPQKLIRAHSVLNQYYRDALPTTCRALKLHWKHKVLTLLLLHALVIMHMENIEG